MKDLVDPCQHSRFRVWSDFKDGPTLLPLHTNGVKLVFEDQIAFVTSPQELDPKKERVLGEDCKQPRRPPRLSCGRPDPANQLRRRHPLLPPSTLRRPLRRRQPQTRFCRQSEAQPTGRLEVSLRGARSTPWVRYSLQDFIDVGIERVGHALQNFIDVAIQVSCWLTGMRYAWEFGLQGAAPSPNRTVYEFSAPGL